MFSLLVSIKKNKEIPQSGKYNDDVGIISRKHNVALLYIYFLTMEFLIAISE